jgi:pyrroloquinoline quinone (PQQ) biosynthesis protein C
MEQIAITQPWDRDTFLAQLRTIGINRYHNKHPFHRYMNNGHSPFAQSRKGKKPFLVLF